MYRHGGGGINEYLSYLKVSTAIPIAASCKFMLLPFAYTLQQQHGDMYIICIKQNPINTYVFNAQAGQPASRRCRLQDMGKEWSLGELIHGRPSLNSKGDPSSS